MATRYYKKNKWGQFTDDVADLLTGQAGKSPTTGTSAGALEILNTAIQNSDLSGEVKEYWAGLPANEKLYFLENPAYNRSVNDFNNLYGIQGDAYDFDTESLLADLAEVGYAQNMSSELEAPVYNVDPEAIRNQVISELQPAHDLALSRLDTEATGLEQLYNQSMANINNQYGRQMSNLMGQQHAYNAQALDTMSSQMTRARQNALEAGASAGIRLAENVNTMLTNQNRQAQTSLQTSNQLAQMLLNQTQAGQEAQANYTQGMADINNRRTGLESAQRQEIDNTSDRYVDRANNDYAMEQERYQSNMDKAWGNVSDTNPFKGSFKTRFSK